MQVTTTTQSTLVSISLSNAGSDVQSYGSCICRAHAWASSWLEPTLPPTASQEQGDSNSLRGTGLFELSPHYLRERRGSINRSQSCDWLCKRIIWLQCPHVIVAFFCCYSISYIPSWNVRFRRHSQLFFKPCGTLTLIALLCFQVVDPRTEKWPSNTVVQHWEPDPKSAGEKGSLNAPSQEGFENL